MTLNCNLSAQNQSKATYLYVLSAITMLFRSTVLFLWQFYNFHHAQTAGHNQVCQSLSASLQTILQAMRHLNINEVYSIKYICWFSL